MTQNLRDPDHNYRTAEAYETEKNIKTCTKILVPQKATVLATASALLPCRTTKTSRFQQKRLSEALKAKLATFVRGSVSDRQRW